MGYVDFPNLPQKKVTAMIVSPQYERVLADLKAMKIELIGTEKCDDVQDPVGFHADILCHHLGGDDIVVYPYSYSLTNSLKELGMNVINSTTRLSQKYPYDISLNAARIGQHLICNEKYTDNAILSGATYDKIIDVKQGYAKCSTMIIDENSIITADQTIATACEKSGFDVLTIVDGGIRLDGYAYGFIGGAGVKLSKSQIYFTGKLSSHSDGVKIREFIEARNIEVIEGSFDSLIDIGSMIPIME
ncbi:MAG: hypothetical protein RR444_10295 [Oscillospiraceae bacterium]